MENRKILNREMIRHVEDIKPGLAGQLLQTFLGHAPGKYAICMEGLRTGDWSAVESAAHSLKSSTGHLGAEKLMELCASLEDAAASARPSDAVAIGKELEAVYAETLAALELELKSWIPAKT
jgi:HPt (histidine-containing phosphotransfer) domain-containing protein